MGEIGQIALSWVLSPVLGGLAAWLLFGFIKKHILVYNEGADEQLRQIKADRIELHKSFKASFERLNEIQQLAYTNAMTRDAALIQERDFDPSELESEYYRDLYRINHRRDNLNTHQALENWVPLLAAGGAALIGAMMLFKGLKNLNLHISTLGNVLILGMVSVVVWMAVLIFLGLSSSKSFLVQRLSYSPGCRFLQHRHSPSLTVPMTSLMRSVRSLRCLMFCGPTVLTARRRFLPH